LVEKIPQEELQALPISNRNRTLHGLNTISSRCRSAIDVLPVSWGLDRIELGQRLLKFDMEEPH
jgi:hypothetical protein